MAITLDSNWPSYLNSCVTTSKSRQTPEGYDFSDTSNGPVYSEQVSRDLPAMWNVTFKFKRNHAHIFQTWLKQNNLRIIPKWFEFPIQLEEGLTTQTVRFTDYPQASGQDGTVFTYTATILAREMVSKDRSDCGDGTLYILLNKSCGASFDKAATCFGEAFDMGWPS